MRPYILDWRDYHDRCTGSLKGVADQSRMLLTIAVLANGKKMVHRSSGEATPNWVNTVAMDRFAEMYEVGWAIVSSLLAQVKIEPPPRHLADLTESTASWFSTA